MVYRRDLRILNQVDLSWNFSSAPPNHVTSGKSFIYFETQIPFWLGVFDIALT